MSDDLSGPAAPPMANGELLFDAPWQGRVFGMARSLCDAGYFTWDEFRERLISEIGVWDESGEGRYDYYQHFLRALEQLMAAKGLIDAQELSARFEAFRHRPHGHDH